jgi:hypothetical protein
MEIWLAVDEDGSECAFEFPPIRERKQWTDRDDGYNWIQFPKGSIEKLLGYKLTWSDEPVMLEEE